MQILLEFSERSLALIGKWVTFYFSVFSNQKEILCIYKYVNVTESSQFEFENNLKVVRHKINILGKNIYIMENQQLSLLEDIICLLLNIFRIFQILVQHELKNL